MSLKPSLNPNNLSFLSLGILALAAFIIFSGCENLDDQRMTRIERASLLNKSDLVVQCAPSLTHVRGDRLNVVDGLEKHEYVMMFDVSKVVKGVWEPNRITLALQSPYLTFKIYENGPPRLYTLYLERLSFAGAANPDLQGAEYRLIGQEWEVIERENAHV